jgi:hypothetical protein
VAGTIEFMMVGQKEQQQTSRYDYYSYRYGRREESESEDAFRVDADIENNRLLLWANDIEIDEVRNLLVKLGEVTADGYGGGRIRILESGSPEETAELFERLRQAWPSLAPGNPLNLPELPETETPEATAPGDAETKQKAETDAQEARRMRGRGFVHAAVFQAGGTLPATDLPQPAGSAATTNPPALDGQPPLGDARPTAPYPTGTRPPGEQGAPVDVNIGPDGELVITCDDPATLDLLEEVVNQLTPRVPDYEIFRLKYADAYYVRLNLEDFFEEEEESTSNRNPFIYYYEPRRQEPEKRSRLSERPKLKFIDDYDTNSILVQGADRNQLKTIRELIEVYDQPLPSDAQTARLSAVFHVKHSKASVIAESVKEVYRDLLSSNDKSLAGNPEQRNRQGSQSMFLFGSSSDDGGRMQASFKGKLSIGVDEVSNTLLVSAEGENLMKNISEMIQILDEAAKPLSSVSVVKLNGGVNAEQVRDILSKVLAEQSGPASSKQQAPGQAPGQGQGRPPVQRAGRGLAVGR